MKILVNKLPEHPEDCAFSKLIAPPSLYVCSIYSVQDVAKKCNLNINGICTYLLEIAITLRSGNSYEI